MISAAILRNKSGCIWGFQVLNHGESNVCAAVSLLALNTANSIEALTDEPFVCDYNPEGGFLKVELPQIKEGCSGGSAELLLEAMVLGLKSVKENYSSEIEIKDDNYDQDKPAIFCT